MAGFSGVGVRSWAAAWLVQALVGVFKGGVKAKQAVTCGVQGSRWDTGFNV